MGIKASGGDCNPHPSLHETMCISLCVRMVMGGGVWTCTIEGNKCFLGGSHDDLHSFWVDAEL